MKTIIFDLDGTLADLTHRLLFVSNGNRQWDEFFKACVDDKPIGNVVELQRRLSEDCGYKIVIVSGRSDVVEQQTREWLSNHGIVHDGLYMRRAGDTRADEVVKSEILDHLLGVGHDILCVFDDRTRVVNMWRKRGLTCFQVNQWEERAVVRKRGLLTLMVGPSGAGKSTWLSGQFTACDAALFPNGLYPEAIINTDDIRRDMCGDFRDQTQNSAVWAAAHALVRCRIKHGLPCVLDATNIKRADRLAAVALADGSGVRYLVINRPMEEKRRDGGWRNSVGFDLLQKHEDTFNMNLKDILAGDGLPNVKVVDLRV